MPGDHKYNTPGGIVETSLETLVSKPQLIVPGDGVHGRRGALDDTCNREKCDDWLHLSLSDDGYDKHEAGNKDDLLSMLLNRERGMDQVEDSKSRLHKFLIDKTFSMQIQEECIAQLHRLLKRYSLSIQTLDKQQARYCEGLLMQLCDIEDRLKIQQYTNNPTQVLHTIKTFVGHNRKPEPFVGNNDELMYRLTSMCKSQDSVWLMSAGRPWLVSDVQAILDIQLQLTKENGAKNCPLNEQERMKLLDKFTGRLTDWRESLKIQDWLRGDLYEMLGSWPEYPGVRYNFMVNVPQFDIGARL